jgi:hypothetical protein
MIADVQIKIWTKHRPKTSLEQYRFTNIATPTSWGFMSWLFEIVAVLSYAVGDTLEILTVK